MDRTSKRAATRRPPGARPGAPAGRGRRGGRRPPSPSACGRPAGTSRPETPSSTASRLPTTSVSTTAVPARIASSGAYGPALERGRRGANTSSWPSAPAAPGSAAIRCEPVPQARPVDRRLDLAPRARRRRSGRTCVGHARRAPRRRRPRSPRAPSAGRGGRSSRRAVTRHRCRARSQVAARGGGCSGSMPFGITTDATSGAMPSSRASVGLAGGHGDERRRSAAAGRARPRSRPAPA